MATRVEHNPKRSNKQWVFILAPLASLVLIVGSGFALVGSYNAEAQLPKDTTNARTKVITDNSPQVESATTTEADEDPSTTASTYSGQTTAVTPRVSTPTTPVTSAPTESDCENVSIDFITTEEISTEPVGTELVAGQQGLSEYCYLNGRSSLPDKRVITPVINRVIAIADPDADATVQVPTEESAKL